MSIGTTTSNVTPQKLQLGVGAGFGNNRSSTDTKKKKITPDLLGSDITFFSWGWDFIFHPHPSSAPGKRYRALRPLARMSIRASFLKPQGVGVLVLTGDGDR